MTLRRNKSLARRRSRQIGAGTPELRERFHRVTITRAPRDEDGTPCCPIADDGEHDGELQAHHVIDQQKLRHYALGADLTDDEADELLWDPDNSLAICRRHHDRHTRAIRRLPLAALELRHLTFAARIDLGYVIENRYRTTEGEPDAA